MISRFRPNLCASDKYKIDTPKQTPRLRGRGWEEPSEPRGKNLQSFNP